MLDCCNSILYNISNREINKLQSLARVVTRSLRFCSVTALLKSLHWLSVQLRIKYKICTLTYNVIQKCHPVYLHNTLKPSTEPLISASQMMINWLFPEWVLGWVKGLFRLRIPPPPALKLYPSWDEEIYNSTVISEKTLYISAKLFHPWSSVSWHAGNTSWNDKRTMITNQIRICSASELGTPRI